MGTPEPHEITETKLNRIAWLSAKDEHKQFNSLMHHFNELSLKDCYHQLAGNKAVGIDGVTKEEYGNNLEANLKDVVARMQRMAYQPSAIREVRIAKEGKTKATRPLGISNFEDKIVQKMMQRVLSSIYEPLFLDCSYGFRPNRGCHDALHSLYHHLYRNRVQIVIDVDLENYFGSIDHKQLLALLREKIKDERLLRYISRMFKAGVLAEGEMTINDEGVVQGSICSPMLANIFAHYVIDDWFEKVVQQHCKGQVALFRYCDDAVICCETQYDATRIIKALQKRLAKYKLRLNESKTRIVSFSKYNGSKDTRRGSFDFLGFTFYWGRSRKGYVVPKLKSCGKRLRVKLKRINDWARKIRNQFRLSDIWRIFCSKLRGHIQYYGVSYNAASLSKFLHVATRILFKWLNRRSQRKSFDWNKFQLFMQLNPLPAIRIYHKFF